MNIPVRLSRAIHLVSAYWTLGLALLIFFDVAGRGLLNQPIPVTKEIIQNSEVAITILQLPLASNTGSKIRTTIFADAVPLFARRLLRSIGYCLGVLFFIGLVLSTFEPAYDAWRIGEYVGEGALRVPTWPVRGLVLVMSVFGAFADLAMIYYDWRGKLVKENEAPGSA